MGDITTQQVTEALKQYIDPYLGRDFVTTKQIANIAVSKNNISIDICLGFPARGYQSTLQNHLQKHLSTPFPDSNINITIDWKIISHTVQQGIKPIPAIKNIIAVASGKGGVGKSTTAVNLALALQAEGANVGILDADIYGPNQPQMLGSRAKPESADGKTMQPVKSHGLQSMSMGYLVSTDTAMIWRGPMVTTALQQLLRETAWHDLDYLIIDLPPGTGDIQLTLAQKIPVSGAVIVTTPQDVALLDAKKGLSMFRKVQVAVLGVVENMSGHVCPKCGYTEAIFGSGGGERFASEFDVELLGRLPLDIRIRKEADGGTPTVAVAAESDIGLLYRDIARKVAAKLALQGKDFSQLFPKIVVENN